MAARLAQLRAQAVQAAEFASKHGGSYYKELMEKNKQYVVQPPTIEKCQELSKQLFYTRLARALVLTNTPYVSKFLPGRYESFWKELDGVKQVWKNRKDLKVEDLGIATLFGVELYAWFCVGEIVGRGFTLTGYKV
uniref:Mitochondrial ATP synthase subunit G protein n=1 Tax=Zea mays TaxID=4577 RepID=A0A804QTR2_MAIZE